MDFSGRLTLPYVTLGPDPGARRHVRQRTAELAPVERFLGRRRHGFTTIVRIERGAGVLAPGVGDTPVFTGDVVVLPPGVVSYAFAGVRVVETLALQTTIESGAIFRRSDLRADAFDRGDEHLVAALKSAPHRTAFARNDRDVTAARALAAIARRSSRARLAAIAHELGYTADGLSALLVRRTGAGFAAWRDALVMASVRARLGTAANVVGVARELDLEPHYLHRRFARAHGTTPGKWRIRQEVPAAAIAHEWDMLLRTFPNA